jgi:hypothetical protein
VKLGDLTGLRLPSAKTLTATASARSTGTEASTHEPDPWLRYLAAGEDGTVTAFVVIFTLALILLAGLVVDGGLTLAAASKRSTKPKPPHARRQAINLAAYRADGPLTLDPGQARQAALDYLATTGHDGTVDVHDNQVDVTVHITQPMQILGIAGIGSLSVTGHGSARPEHGVEAAEP